MLSGAVADGMEVCWAGWWVVQALVSHVVSGSRHDESGCRWGDCRRNVGAMEGRRWWWCRELKAQLVAGGQSQRFETSNW
jgi:hypothetical protein